MILTIAFPRGDYDTTKNYFEMSLFNSCLFFYHYVIRKHDFLRLFMAKLMMFSSGPTFAVLIFHIFSNERYLILTKYIIPWDIFFLKYGKLRTILDSSCMLNFKVNRKTLQETTQIKNPKNGGQTNALLKKKTENFLFVLHVIRRILSQCEILLKTLQCFSIKTYVSRFYKLK